MALSGEALLQDRLFRHLATLVTVPATTFAWPNIAHNGSVPRLEVQHVPNTARSSLLNNSKDLQGFVIVSVITDQGVGTTDAHDIATQVVDHFKGLTLHTDDYRIRFIQPGSISQSLPDGAELRTPVSIPYLAND